MYIARSNNEAMMDIHEKMLHNIPYINEESMLDSISLKKRRDLMIEIENQYGKFEYQTEKAITLPKGLLGIEEFNIYGLRKLEHSKYNYMLLQSLESAEVSFIVMPLIITADGITLEDATKICNQLENKNQEDVMFFGILSMKSKEIAINLKSTYCA